MPEDPTPQQWQLRPEAGGRLANRLLRPLAFGLGRPVARFITFFAALYFMLRRGPERAASRDYLGRILGRPAGWRDVYRHFLCFSTTVLDRVYLMADRFSRFDVQTVGLEALSDARDQGRGVLVLSAHLGSFDALRVMSLRNPDVSTRILLDVGQNAALLCQTRCHPQASASNTCEHHDPITSPNMIGNDNCSKITAPTLFVLEDAQRLASDAEHGVEVPYFELAVPPARFAMNFNEQKRTAATRSPALALRI